jgi:hypothetical protein
MSAHVYLTKANNDLVSFCKCDSALITSPPQADCPWCGCGWLFTCINCRKAFTFATAIETDRSWEDLSRADLRGELQVDPSADQIAEWISFMKSYIGDAIVGATYVAFDGRLIATTQTHIEFDGWHATHKLDFVPQVAAMNDASIRNRILNSEEYWQGHALGEMSPSALGQPALRDREKKWWEFWR